MKKFLAILLSMGMVFSLVACGPLAGLLEGKDESTEVVESSVEEVEETTEESTESTEVENEEDSFVAHPATEGVVVGDYWYFEADTTGNGETKWVVYDLVADEVIGESDMKIHPQLNAYSDGNGRQIYGTSMSECNYGSTIIDICTGEEVLKLNENQEFFGYFDDDGNIIVLETQENFEGNTYSFAMVNYKGEWVSDFIPIEYAGFNREYHWNYMGEGKYLYPNAGYDSDNLEQLCCIYDGINGNFATVGLPSLVDFGATKDYMSIWEVRDEEVFYSVHDYYDRDIVYMYYNMLTGESREIARMNGICEGSDSDSRVIIRNDNTYALYDESGSVTTFDLSEYEHDGFNFINDKVFFVTENEQGTEFVCLMNADGSMEFEPINSNEFPFTTSNYMGFSEEKIVSWDNEGAVFVYNITTKELINSEMPYVVKSYIPEKDMFIVEGEHPEYGAGVYLVYADDLETLINPFE